MLRRKFLAFILSGHRMYFQRWNCALCLNRVDQLALIDITKYIISILFIHVGHTRHNGFASTRACCAIIPLLLRNFRRCYANSVCRLLGFLCVYPICTPVRLSKPGGQSFFKGEKFLLPTRHRIIIYIGLFN